MPIIEGYDEVEVATVGVFKSFTAGNHMATVKKALYEDGFRNGEAVASLIIDLEGNAGETGRVYISIPTSSAQWASWNPKPGKKSGLRNLVKSQLVNLGIDMSEVESVSARERLIGNQYPINVSINGKYTNILFRDPASMDAGNGFPTPPVMQGAAPVEPSAGETVIV